MLYFLPLLIKNAWNVNVLATRPRQSAGSRTKYLPAALLYRYPLHAACGLKNSWIFMNGHWWVIRGCRAGGLQSATTCPVQPVTPISLAILVYYDNAIWFKSTVKTHTEDMHKCHHFSLNLWAFSVWRQSVHSVMFGDYDVTRQFPAINMKDAIVGMASGST